MHTLLLTRRLASAQPGQPRPLWSANRLCDAVSVHRQQQRHRQNVYNIKPMIDNRDPRRPRTANSKGARMEAERNAQIMHENAILLNKLSRVLTRDAEPPRANFSVRGLHDPVRKMEREKIDRDNLQLLRRLQYVQPTVSIDQQHREHAALLASNRNFAANPFLLNSGSLAAGSGIAAARRRPLSARVERPSSSSSGTRGEAYTQDAQEGQPSPPLPGGPYPPVQEGDEAEAAP
jgi:hypothetical protein